MRYSGDVLNYTKHADSIVCDSNQPEAVTLKSTFIVSNWYHQYFKTLL